MDSYMNLSSLIPTHNEVRDRKSIRSFVNFLREGRIYRGQEKLISINRFEDGSLYVRDGHHRVCAAIIVGMTDLLDCEYEIEEYTYEDYMTANFRNGFFTPFDPRTQCRLANFFDFKDKALKLFNELNNYADFPNPADYSAVFDFIETNSAKYVEPRKVHSFKELLSNYRH